MRDLDFIRDYDVEVMRLWRAVTTPVQLLQWFGPEGVFIDACEMDFERPGPWWCAMRGKESYQVFKVSGQVTSVHPPEDGRGSVSFTWAWHDAADRRGPESFVSFTVEATAAGARLTLSHRELADTETAQDHTTGWLSTLRKLDRFFGKTLAEQED
ncbi:SRPBCC family protein [Mesobacterium pallidum]|uniref:SRPBCC family protein n=1 Tax=Mesobacterium pallidum TaxID=2872037 RepID=UPI001EE2744E|nr:SRPBCC domain-containing protein [Mesobacterium pallidum]